MRINWPRLYKGGTSRLTKPPLSSSAGNREGNAVKEMNSCKLMIRGVAKALGTAVEKGYDGEDMVAMRDSAHRLLDTVTAFIDEHKDSAN